jgi:hypothetical protein
MLDRLWARLIDGCGTFQDTAFQITITEQMISYPSWIRIRSRAQDTVLLTIQDTAGRDVVVSRLLEPRYRSLYGRMASLSVPRIRRSVFPRVESFCAMKNRILWSLLPVWVFLFLLLLCWLVGYVVMTGFEIRNLQP